MSNDQHIEVESLEPNPESVLDSKVLELIKIFVEENRNSYKAYSSELSSDYMDCTIFSKKLRDLLLPFIPDLKLVYIGNGYKEERLFGEVHKFPKDTTHAAIASRSLGIIIEPQTGVVTWIDNDKQKSAFKYYAKGLSIQDPSFMFSSEVVNKADITKATQST